MGRQAGGIAGVRVAAKEDAVVALDAVRPEGSLLVVTASGAAKRMALSEFPAQGRGGGGVACAKVTPRTGPVAYARVVSTGEEAAVCTTDGQVWRGPAGAIAAKGRGHSLEPVPDLVMGTAEAVAGLTTVRYELDSRVRLQQTRARDQERTVPGVEATGSGEEPVGHGPGRSRQR